MVPASVDPLTIVAQMQEQLAVLRQQIARSTTGSPGRRIDHGSAADEYRDTHEAIKADRELWQSLSFAGLQHDGRGGLVELRHCPSCQSTIARPITQAEAHSLCELQAELAKRSKLTLAEAAEDHEPAEGQPPSDANQGSFPR